jgi:regulator of protease activity HflC (stomatin/prohibitin superfamily)
MQPCHQVNVRQELVLLNYGRFLGVLREPGFYFINPCGRDAKFISTKVESTDLPALKVIDKRGNPYGRDPNGAAVKAVE